MFFRARFIFLVLVSLAFALTGFISGDKSENRIESSVICTANSILSSCNWNGIELSGKVQFVESFPDIKIQIVESFPDLKVKLVESFPDDCGEWQIVESFPDFKVQIVESFADIKVQYVESFPGLP